MVAAMTSSATQGNRARDSMGRDLEERVASVLRRTGGTPVDPVSPFSLLRA